MPVAIPPASGDGAAAGMPGAQGRVFLGRDIDDPLLNFLATEMHRGTASSQTLSRSLMTGLPHAPVLTPLLPRGARMTQGVCWAASLIALPLLFLSLRLPWHLFLQKKREENICVPLAKSKAPCITLT